MSEPIAPYDTEDEINIGQLVLTLLTHWKLIVASALLSASAGMWVGSAAPYSASIEFKPLTSRETAVFHQINDFLVTSKFVQSDATGKPPLDSDRFLTELMASVDDSELFREVAARVRERELGELDEASQIRYVARLRGQFTLTPPQLDETRKTGSPYWTLALTSTEREKDLHLLTMWLETATQKAVAGLRMSLLARAESFDTANRFKAEDLKRELDYQREDYKKSINQTLANLDEQAKIARALGIAKGTLEGTTFSANASVVTNIKSDNPLYVRGYEALEREAKLIRERKDEREFIRKSIEVEAQLRSLQDSPNAKRLRGLVEGSPLVEPDFKLAKTDLSLLEFERKIGPFTGGLIGLLMGSFLGIFLAILFAASRREIQKQRT